MTWDENGWDATDEAALFADPIAEWPAPADGDQGWMVAFSNAPPPAPLTLSDLRRAIDQLLHDRWREYEIVVDEQIDGAFLIENRASVAPLRWSADGDRLLPFLPLPQIGRDFILTGSTSAIGGVIAYHLAGAYWPEGVPS